VDVPVADASTVAWSAPGASLYGAHPIVLRVNMTAGGNAVQARVPGVVQVALPSGIVPIEPSYRIALQAWLRDWR
jgi:hypothetical protein